jgi:S1-C subfamily serine protease
MSGQPTGDDSAEAPAEPGWPDSPVWPEEPAMARSASTASAVPGSPSRPDGSTAPADTRRQLSGALLPGEWARAGLPGQPPAPHERESSGPKRPARLRGLLTGELRGGRLAVAAGVLALACTILGGVVGGYIALHSQGGQTDPSYNVGTVPAAVAGRPASSVAGVAARVTPSVVMIKVNGGQGTGSGFIIRGGYIVTDNHVVTLDNQVPNAAIRVYFSNGSSVPGRLVGRDPYADIAIIKVDGTSRLPALTLGNSAAVAVGDPVIAVGSPLGLADTVTSGIVSAVDRPVQPGQTASTTPQVFFDAIQTDAPINPGNSGGPLVNAKGQVIGVDAAIDTLGNNPLTGTQGGSIGLGFAIPINQARRVAVELIRTGHSTHAVIGANINAGWGGNGAQITSSKAAVTPGGPAALAGIRAGDVIVRFAGQPVANGNALLDAVRSAPPGATVSVTFLRNGQQHMVTVRLGSAPS